MQSCARFYFFFLFQLFLLPAFIFALHLTIFFHFFCVLFIFHDVVVSLFVRMDAVWCLFFVSIDDKSVNTENAEHTRLNKK